MVNFTKGLAMEGAGHQGQRRGARAGVDSPHIPATMPAEFVSQFEQQESPMGRLAQPVELVPPLHLPRLPEVEIRQRRDPGRDRRNPLP